MSHKRNTTAMRESPRCGAKTRNGTPCRAPAVKRKHRCRMHGGAAGSGAPRANQNALKHGRYTKEHQNFMREIRAQRRSLEETLRQIKDEMKAAKEDGHSK